MRFTQIAVARVGKSNEGGSGYDLAVFALNADGELWSFKTHYGDMSRGEWKKVSDPNDSQPTDENEITGGDEGEDMLKPSHEADDDT